MKVVRIPKDRIGALIGHKGDTKLAIEKIGKTYLDIDSEEGDITINVDENSDPLLIMQVENVIRAIGRGFSPQNAFQLFKEGMCFYLFDIHEYVGKKENHVHRLKSRIIGREGKTKRHLERLTGAELTIYGHTIGIIADMEIIEITKYAVDMLLSGSKHASVYEYVDREIKKLKMDRML